MLGYCSARNKSADQIVFQFRLPQPSSLQANLSIHFGIGDLKRFVMNFQTKKIYTGYELRTDGIIRAGHFQDSDFTRAYHPVPVQWQGTNADLRFWNYVKSTPLNRSAMNLIVHPNFTIRGRAIVVTRTETWFRFCLPGSESDARTKLAHIQHGFCDLVIYKPAGRHQTHTSICARSEDDAFAIKMVL